MSSIIHELQSEALGKQIPITDLLRKAFMVARKLKVKELEKWVQSELDGYQEEPKNIPNYRIIYGVVKVWNPYQGWRAVIFETDKDQKSLSQRRCYQPISEIEHMLEHCKGGKHFEASFSAEVTQLIMDSIGTELQPSLHITAGALSRIIDSVRNIVLKWALQLEEDGILGEGVSFSNSEIQKATQAGYTFNLFAGDVVNSQVQQGTQQSCQKKEVAND